MTVAETVRMGSWLNPHFDEAATRDRLGKLDIDPKRRVGKLSGGQQAQLALALALGKQPDLLVLDEPVANLDPLARRDFLRMVMADVAETGRSVLFSSHLLGDLQNTCDFLVLLSASRVQLTGDVETLTRQHLMLSGPRQRVAALQAAHTVVQIDESGRHASLLVRAHGPINDPTFTSRPATLEELTLAYMSSTLARPTHLQLATDPTEVSA
jgi:ABC-2 type transport system ATP-binding protein